ncbi:hypothetical protein BJX65DRAFT_237595 [Aspergillus insuetus]
MVWRVEGSAGRVTDSRRKRVKAKRFEEGEEKKAQGRRARLLGNKGAKDRRWGAGRETRDNRGGGDEEECGTNKSSTSRTTFLICLWFKV